MECVQWVRELVASSLQHVAVECEFESRLSQHVISVAPFCVSLRRLDISVCGDVAMWHEGREIG